MNHASEASSERPEAVVEELREKIFALLTDEQKVKVEALLEKSDRRGPRGRRPHGDHPDRTIGAPPGGFGELEDSAPVDDEPALDEDPEDDENTAEEPSEQPAAPEQDPDES